MRCLISLALATTLAAPAWAQTSVGVSIGINQPGVYGRIDIGNMPPPAVVYPQPVIIVPRSVAVVQQPLYLYVPPGHQKHWAKHCRRYNACGQPVYFVQEDWVRERYAEQHGGDDERDRGGRRGKQSKGKQSGD
jgi:hypothetical protein